MEQKIHFLHRKPWLRNVQESQELIKTQIHKLPEITQKWKMFNILRDFIENEGFS